MGNTEHNTAKIHKKVLAKEKKKRKFVSKHPSQSISQHLQTDMNCRIGCGACCIAPSISTPIPGMPDGKPAGVRCVQLTEDNRCSLFGKPERPHVCRSLIPTEEMCGKNDEEALQILLHWEDATKPG